VQDPAKQNIYSAVENISSTFQLPLWPEKGETGKELLLEKFFPVVFKNFTDELSHPL